MANYIPGVTDILRFLACGLFSTMLWKSSVTHLIFQKYLYMYLFRWEIIKLNRFVKQFLMDTKYSRQQYSVLVIIACHICRYVSSIFALFCIIFFFNLPHFSHFDCPDVAEFLSKMWKFHRPMRKLVVVIRNNWISVAALLLLEKISHDALCCCWKMLIRRLVPIPEFLSFKWWGISNFQCVCQV